jgi:hypothetical protein
VGGGVTVEEVPIQYFQSVIAIELGVAGALLFQIRFFAPRGEEDERLPDARLRLALAVVLGATIFGSLGAMLHGGDKTAAAALLIGLAVSLLPILLRALPRLGRDPQTNRRDREIAVTIAGVVLYILLVTGALILIES